MIVRNCNGDVLVSRLFILILQDQKQEIKPENATKMGDVPVGDARLLLTVAHSLLRQHLEQLPSSFVSPLAPFSSQLVPSVPVEYRNGSEGSERANR